MADEPELESSQQTAFPAPSQPRASAAPPVGDSDGSDVRNAVDAVTRAIKSGGGGGPASKEPKRTAPTYDEGLLARAESLGISKDEVPGLGDPETVQRTLDLIDRSLGKFALRAEPSKGKDNGQKPSPVPSIPNFFAVPSAGSAAPTDQPAAPAKPAPTTPPTTSQQWRFEPVQIDPDEYGPDVAKLGTHLNGMHGHFDGRVQRLEQTLTALMMYLGQRHDREQMTRFDNFVNGLDEAYAAKLGRGPTSKLVANSGELKARQALRETANVLRAAYTQTGREPPNDDELFGMALRLMYADVVKTQARSEVEERQRDRAGRFIAPPTGRKGAGPAKHPVDAAVAAVSAKWPTETAE